MHVESQAQLSCFALRGTWSSRALVIHLFRHALTRSLIHLCDLHRPQAHGDIDLLFNEATMVTEPSPHMQNKLLWVWRKAHSYFVFVSCWF